MISIIKKYKIILISIGFGILFWIADAFIDSFIFHREIFLDYLFLKMTPYEIYMRSVGFLFFILFGLFLYKQKKIKRAFKAAKAKYQYLFEANIDAVAFMDAETFQIIDINDKALEIYGYDNKEEVLKLKAEDFTAEPRNTLKELNRIQDEDSLNIPLSYHKKKDGTIFPVVTFLGSFDVGGKKIICGITKDITKEEEIKKALELSEAKYRNIFSNNLDAVLLINAETMKILEVNNAAVEYYGYSADEFLKLNLSDISAEFDKTIKAVEKTRNGNMRKISLRYHKRKDGSVFPVEISPCIFKLNGDEIICGIIKDITEKRQIEGALKEIKDKYYSLFNNMLNGFALHKMIFDNQGNPIDYIFIEINKAFEKNTGFKRKDLIGRRVTEAIPGIEKDSAGWIGRYGEVVLTGKEMRFEQFSQVLNRWYSVLAYSTGKGYFAAVFEDITEKRKAEEELKDSERKMRAWLDHSPVCTKIIDLDFNLQYMSVAGIKSLKIDDITEFYGKPYPFYLYSESLRNTITKNLEEVKETGRVITQETFIVDKKSNKLWYHSTLVPVNDSKGKIDYIMIVSNDITARKKMEEDILNEAKLRAVLLDNMSCVAMILKRDTREIVTSNEAAKNEGAVVGGKCYEVCFNRNIQCPWCCADKLGNNGKSQSLEVEYKGKWYKCAWANYSKDLYVHYLFDITEAKNAERTLIESEERFRAIFEESSSLIFIVNPNDAKIIEVNDMACKITGYSKEELKTFKIKDIGQNVSEEDIKRRVEEMSKKGSIIFEAELKTKQSGIRHVAINAKSIRLLGKTFVLVIGHDITEFKKAESKIRDQSEFLRSVLDSFANPFYTIDIDSYKIKMVNAVARSRGIKENESCYEVFHEDKDFCEREDFCPVKRVKMSKEPVVIEHTCCFKNGKPKNIEIHAYPVFNEKNEVYQIIVYSLDITERKKAEKTLKFSEMNLKKAQEVANIGSWYLNIIENELHWSEEEYHIFEISLGTELNYKRFLEHVHPEDREYVDKKFDKALGGELYDIEYRVLVSDRIKWVREKAEFKFNENGEAVSGMGITQDITERKKSQQALREAYRKLKDTQEQLIQSGKMAAMGQLAAGISHELNQPLTGIKGFAQVMFSDIDSKSPLRKDLIKIIQQANRMDKIIKNVRSFAKKSEFKMELVKINEPIQDALSLMFEQLRINDIEVVREFANELPQIRGDINQLQQVFINLLNNAKDAIKASEEGNGGQINISTSLDRDGHKIKIVVQDTGCGMPEENIKDVFNPFFTTKSPKGGIGLGLSIVYRIIQEHNGSVSCVSQKDVGTDFIIHLPVVEKNDFSRLDDAVQDAFSES